MTLDEAIKRANEISESKIEDFKLCPYTCDGKTNCKVLKNGKDKGCLKCAEEYKQFAEWFIELKQLKMQDSCDDCISRKALIEKATSWDTHFTDSERYISLSDIKALQSVKPQLSEDSEEYKSIYENGYLKGQIDAVKECTEKLRKINTKFGDKNNE